ncbi:MAG TPA: hypothetical protein VH419_07270, partial [Nocardioidaceae bacterium]
MGTVFLHVGTMKSGTSYVQSTLNKNADALAGFGISWHGMQETNLAVQDLTASKLSMPGSKGAWDRLAAKVRATDGDTVISMELLGPCSRRIRHKIAESLGRPQLHLVVTWRDVTKVALSHWQENAQNRQEIGWEQYAEEITAPDRPSGRPHRFWMHHDVAALLSRWSDVVDPQAMTVITVPSGADQDELWRRFARVIGVPDERARAMPTSRPKNASLGAISAELMLRLNARTRQLGWPQYRLGVKVPLAKRVLSSRAADEPRFALKPEHHKLLRERALTMVDAVAASPAS